MKMCGKKKFLPAGFASKAQFEKMQGVYFPYWYVDEQMQSSAVASAKKVRHWTSGNRRYTETSRFRLYRTGDININNVFEEALRDKKSANQNPNQPQSNRAANAQEAMKYLEQYQLSKRHEMLQCVHPYDVSKAVPFAMSYLSGFKAEKRELDRKDIEADIWRKYILNCAYNVSTARYNCNVGGLRADPVKMQEYEALVYEALAVAMKKGVHVSTEDAEGIMYRIREEQADNASSSLKRDVEAGRPAEIETFSGYIVREGQRLGVPVPVSERFYEALKEMCR